MLTKEYMIEKIKEHTDKYGNPYSRIRISGGEARLEDAPAKNIYGMYVAVCLTGRKGRKELV